jgi:hypothetical protein
LSSGFDESSLATPQWPVERPAGWCEIVNLPQSDLEVEAIRESLRREQPLGEPAWQSEMIGPRRSKGRPGASTRRISACPEGSGEK